MFLSHLLFFKKDIYTVFQRLFSFVNLIQNFLFNLSHCSYHESVKTQIQKDFYSLMVLKFLSWNEKVRIFKMRQKWRVERGMRYITQLKKVCFWEVNLGLEGQTITTQKFMTRRGMDINVTFGRWTQKKDKVFLLIKSGQPWWSCYWWWFKYTDSHVIKVRTLTQLMDFVTLVRLQKWV